MLQCYFTTFFLSSFSSWSGICTSCPGCISSMQHLLFFENSSAWKTLSVWSTFSTYVNIPVTPVCWVHGYRFQVQFRDGPFTGDEGISRGAQGGGPILTTLTPKVSSQKCILNYKIVWVTQHYFFLIWKNNKVRTENNKKNKRK